VSKLLKTALAKCYDPPHDFWRMDDPDWLRCSKCGLVTSVEVLKKYAKYFT